MLDKVAQTSLLFDFYGNLLTDKQQEVMNLYHEENMSLGEIAEERGVSRQAIHFTLKQAEKSLETYENKLGLVARFQQNAESISRIGDELKTIDVKRLTEEERDILNEILEALARLE